MKKLKGAIIGCGFWSQFQLGGWTELDNVEIVALYNRTLSRAERLGKMFGIRHCYDDPVKMLENHPEIDFVDILKNNVTENGIGRSVKITYTDFF